MSDSVIVASKTAEIGFTDENAMRYGTRMRQERYREDSKLLIKGVDANGEFFFERSQTNDISDSGISFFLNKPMWVDSHLKLIIANSQVFGRLYRTHGKVARVKIGPDGRQLVALRLD